MLLYGDPRSEKAKVVEPVPFFKINFHFPSKIPLIVLDNTDNSDITALSEFHKSVGFDNVPVSIDALDTVGMFSAATSAAEKTGAVDLV